MEPTQSLSEELASLQKSIRADASNGKLRVYLFQLLCVIGDWKRALAQLQVCAQLDVKALPMAQTYREAIRCEVFRAEVFAGRKLPQVMGQPPAWMGLMLEALKHDGEGNIAAAASLRESAMAMAEPHACAVNGSACEWLCDGDARLGPVCEVIANGQYYWLPFESIAALDIEAPADLRDVVWAPGELTLRGEGRMPVLLPSRYPETVSCVDGMADALKRGKLTEWKEHGPDAWRGLGQRVWMSDVGEHAILDVRSLTFQSLGDSPVAPA